MIANYKLWRNDFGRVYHVFALTDDEGVEQFSLMDLESNVERSEFLEYAKSLIDLRGLWFPIDPILNYDASARRLAWVDKPK